MPTPFISYYEHLAKLSTVANKKTMFLAHMLSNLEFSRSVRLHIVDMTSHRKIEIMKNISPELTDPVKAINRANQYMNELKKAGLVKPMKGLRGTWMIDPMSFGGMKVIRKQIRTQNAKVFANYVFSYNDSSLDIQAIDENGQVVHFEENNSYDQVANE